MVLNVTTFTSLKPRVIEVTVIASPAFLNIATFASFEFRYIPPIGLVHPSPTSFHVVSFGVANVAGGAGPIVLNIAALLAGLKLWYVLFAVFAVPIILNILAFWTSFKFGHTIVLIPANPVILGILAFWTQFISRYLKITVFAEPPHQQ